MPDRSSRASPSGGAASAAVPVLADVVAGALLALHAVLAWLVRAPGLTTGNDDAVYLVLSRAVRTLHYTQLHVVGAPVEAQYPPLYPTFLALVSAIGGERLDLLIAANILLSVLALGLCYAAVRRQFPLIAVLALALLVANPDLLKLAGALRSEPLLMATAAAALFLSARPDPGRAHLIGAGAAAIAAALARSAGVTVIAALFLTWLFTRRLRPALWLAAAAAITVGPWLVWTVVAPRDVAGRSYVSDVLVRAPSTADLPAPAANGPVESPGAVSEARPPAATPAPPSLIGTLARRLIHNPAVYARSTLEALHVPTIAGTWVDNVVWLAAVVLLCLVGGWGMLRWWPAAAAWLVCYATLLLVWPYTVRRFVAPVLPIVVIALLAGAQRIGRRIRRADARSTAGMAFPVLFALAVGIGVAFDAGSALERSAACDRGRPFESAGCYDADERAFFAAAAYAADSIPAGARFFTSKDGIFFVRSGHQAVVIAAAIGLDGPALRAYLERSGASYVLLAHLKIDEWALARPLREICHELRLEGFWAPATVLLGIPPPGVAGDGRACDAIDTYDSAPWGERALP